MRAREFPVLSTGFYKICFNGRLQKVIRLSKYVTGWLCHPVSVVVVFHIFERKLLTRVKSLPG